jgi:nanoRNase/pAp phosphatase (c-di-AMP/oligoRNAs hydrolase)
MMKLLDLEVLPLTVDGFEEFDRVALVDTQPPHLRQGPKVVDVVIDHHPEQTGYEARFRDVRNAYGATATILTEYLRAGGEKIHERLATALLYAIRTDTLLLDRNVTEMDVEAFTHLYPRANLNQIRRIERPELPVSVLGSFARGLTSARIEEKVIFSHLGSVDREDVVPQLAEFCLQVEGVEWSVVSGIYEGELSISVRNVGFVQAAGVVIKEAFRGLGIAGGHRSMAKAILPLDGLPRCSNGSPTRGTYRKLEERFLERLKERPE